MVILKTFICKRFFNADKNTNFINRVKQIELN